jgi:hypothetical protein
MSDDSGSIAEFGIRANQVIAELRRRGALEFASCAQCHRDDWNVDLVRIEVKRFEDTKRPPFSALYGQMGMDTYIPAATITCKNCGYTIIHNLNLLGIKL